MVEINTEIRFLDAYLMGEYSPIDTVWRCMIILCMSMKWISYERASTYKVDSEYLSGMASEESPFAVMDYQMARY